MPQGYPAGANAPGSRYLYSPDMVPVGSESMPITPEAMPSGSSIPEELPLLLKDLKQVASLLQRAQDSTEDHYVFEIDHHSVQAVIRSAAILLRNYDEAEAILLRNYGAAAAQDIPDHRAEAKVPSWSSLLSRMHGRAEVNQSENMQGEVIGFPVPVPSARRAVSPRRYHDVGAAWTGHSAASPRAAPQLQPWPQAGMPITAAQSAAPQWHVLIGAGPGAGRARAPQAQVGGSVIRYVSPQRNANLGSM